MPMVTQPKAKKADNKSKNMPLIKMNYKRKTFSLFATEKEETLNESQETMFL
jgi:hypothetical protein